MIKTTMLRMVYMTMTFLLIWIGIYVVTCQEWTWLNGYDTANQPSSVITPGGRSGSYSWKDLNGNVWLFGGKGFSNLGNGTPILLNDLWKYNIHSNSWSQVHPGTVSSSGRSSSDSDSPSPRYLGSSCGVTNLTFVIYGGIGEKDEMLGDTWVYYFKSETWLLVDWYQVDQTLFSDDDLEDIGNSTVDSNGDLLNPSTDLNITMRSRNVSQNVYLSPGSRGNMVSWCLYDSILIFSGVDQNKSLLSDMWRFSFKKLLWHEVTNVTVMNDSGTDRKSPLPRSGASTWVYRADILFMFGGNTIPHIRQSHSTVGYTSDLWRFNLTDLSWKLMKGPTERQTSGKYGNIYSVNSNNTPGSRQGASAWVDSNNNLWLFGGDGMDRVSSSLSKLLSDLWRFNIKELMWSWMGGSNVGEAKVKFSKQGEVSSEVQIGGRCEASVWTGEKNHFYMFGGLGHDSHQKDGYLNDLWMMSVEEMVNPSSKITLGAAILFSLIIISILLLIAAVSLYARDRSGPFHRFDQNIKYTHLSTTGD